MKELVNEAIEALENRDAVKCYESMHSPCQCTLCKLKRFRGYLNSAELSQELNSIMSHAFMGANIDELDWQMALGELERNIKKLGE